MKHCWFCHGEAGDAKTEVAYTFKVPPRDFTSQSSRKELTHKRIIDSVYGGRVDTAMPAFQYTLSKSEIEAVAVYIMNDLMVSGRHVKKGNQLGAKKQISPHYIKNSRLPIKEILQNTNEKNIILCLTNCHTNRLFLEKRIQELE